jgi:hypothetical protein
MEAEPQRIEICLALRESKCKQKQMDLHWSTSAIEGDLLRSMYASNFRWTQIANAWDKYMESKYTKDCNIRDELETAEASQNKTLMVQRSSREVADKILLNFVLEVKIRRHKVCLILDSEMQYAVTASLPLDSHVCIGSTLIVSSVTIYCQCTQHSPALHMMRAVSDIAFRILELRWNLL